MNRILLICISLLTFISLEGFAKERTVFVTVTTSEDGSVLPGVTVAAKGSMAIGTVTESDGKFNLSVPPNLTTLTLSYIGTTPQKANTYAGGCYWGGNLPIQPR